MNVHSDWRWTNACQFTTINDNIDHVSFRPILFFVPQFVALNIWQISFQNIFNCNYLFKTTKKRKRKKKLNTKLTNSLMSCSRGVITRGCQSNRSYRTGNFSNINSNKMGSSPCGFQSFLCVIGRGSIFADIWIQNPIAIANLRTFVAPQTAMWWRMSTVRNRGKR